MSLSILKRPLMPVIDINKTAGGTYQFNHFNSLYDFRVRKLSFEPAFDALGGKFDLTLSSPTGSNSGANTILSNIEEGNELVIWVGKTDALKKKMFRGIIETIEIDETHADFMDISLKGPDWGSYLLKNRIVNNGWVQEKTGDGITLNQSDNKVLLQQIVLDLLTKTISYPAVDITVENQGLIVDPLNITPPTIRLAQFYANMEFLDDKLRELDDYGGTIHYVDPDKNFIMKQALVSSSSLPASILLTDDYNDPVALSWDQTKLGLILPQAKYKRTLENHKRRIFGLGGDQETIDQSSTGVTGSTKLDANHLAELFKPRYRGLSKIAINLDKVGSPTLGPVIEVREDFNGRPTGSVLKTIMKDKAAIGATAAWSWFTIGEDDLNTSKDYWIVFRKTGDVNNTYRWYHDNADNNPAPSATSADDVTWNLTTTPNRFKYSHRIYTSNPILAIYAKAALANSKHFHEDVIRKPSITETSVMWQLLRSEGENLTKKKEIPKFFVYSPDTLLENAQKIRIRKQLSGYQVDGEFFIGKVEYNFESEEEGTGAWFYGIEAARFVAYT